MIFTLYQAVMLEKKKKKNHQKPPVPLTVNHTLTYGSKTRLWGKQIHDCHIFTSIKLQNYLPNWNSQCCTSCILFFHLKSLTTLVCKNSEPDPRSASDLVAHNSCTIPSSFSKIPTLFYLFGPSTSLKYHKFQIGNRATFHNFPEETENAWLLVGVIYILQFSTQIWWFCKYYIN